MRSTDAIPIEALLEHQSFVTKLACALMHNAADADDVELGTEVQADVESAGAANSGDQFRRDDATGKFVYNLSTGGLTSGTYRAQVRLDNGSTHSVSFSLAAR